MREFHKDMSDPRCLKASPSSAGSTLERIRDLHHLTHHQKVLLSCRSKEVTELTDHEKMSIYICAGVPTAYKRGMLTTTVPVSIQKINGKFVVAVNSNEKR